MFTENQISLTTEQVSNDLFSKVKYQAYLNGSQIAQFCHYEQVNRFILFQIYTDWKAQIQKIKHPYFNFQAQEVKVALEEFVNVLSNHIQVEQKDFKILLDRAVYNVIKLLNDPLSSFFGFFFVNKNEVSTSLISEYLPYFYDFDFILQSILLYAKNHHLEKISKEQFQDLYHKTVLNFERFSEISFDNYRSQKFKALIGESMNRLEKEVLATVRSIQMPKEKKVEELNPIKKQEEKIPAVNVSQALTSKPTAKEIKIKKIPLNKQFQYSQKLFKGDIEALKNFCEQIAEINDLEIAKKLIQQSVIENYQIDPEDKLFQEFATLALAHVV